MKTLFGRSSRTTLRSALSLPPRLACRGTSFEALRDVKITTLFVTHDIDEAVYLAERVIVLSSTPTIVQRERVVDLPGERDQLSTRSLPHPQQRSTMTASGGHSARVCSTRHSVRRRGTNTPASTRMCRPQNSAQRTHPSKANEEAFELAVHEIARISRHLLEDLVSSAPPKNREIEAEKAKARSQKRFAAA